MKPADLLTTIFHHNLWANIRLLERCSELSDAELDATLVGTYGSIRDTLQHIIWSELSLYTRIKTGQPYRRPEDSPKPTLPELLESAWTTGAGLIEEAGLAQVGDTVQVDRDGVPRDMPKCIILTQAINHATEHRAQIRVTLTQSGIEPPDLDSWTFFREGALESRS